MLRALLLLLFPHANPSFGSVSETRERVRVSRTRSFEHGVVPGAVHSDASSDHCDAEVSLDAPEPESPKEPLSPRETAGLPSAGTHTQADPENGLQDVAPDASSEGSLLEPNFVSRLCWQQSVKESRVIAQKMPGVVKGHRPDEVSEQADTGGGCALQWMIRSPNTPHQRSYELVGAILILFDLLTIPVFISFGPPESTFTIVMDWIGLIYWTLNIPMSFTVGYLVNGVMVNDARQIAIKYAQTWLFLDLAVVVPDWVMTIDLHIHGTDNNAGDSLGLLRTVRYVRLMRMIRLLRVLKLRKLLAKIDELIDSEHLSIVANIVKMILALLVTNHIIACCWYTIADTNNERNWLTHHSDRGDSWEYLYATSFHWSVTQFTPASMDVQPHNMRERCFAIAVVVFALVQFSYLLGSITGSLTQLRSIQETATKQFRALRIHLRHCQVPLDLRVRIERYLEHQHLQQRSIANDHLQLLALLSTQLHDELQCAVYVPRLSVHPLFEHLSVHHTVTMNRLASKAISTQKLARGDVLFQPWEGATHMYVVAEGKLKYVRTDSRGQEHIEWVDKGEDWISEPVLWTPAWVHLGLLTAETECELLLVDASVFGKVVVLNPPSHQLLMTYSRNFLRWLNDQGFDSLSDIWQGEEVGNLVRSMLGSESSHTADSGPVFTKSKSQHTAEVRPESSLELS